MLEFKASKHIFLKLEDNNTNIYINGTLFRQCKSIYLNIPKEDNSILDDIRSIDEAEDILGTSKTHAPLTPEEEFFGHCSNIRAWVENDYNTDILHYRLAFPLLKKLFFLRDPIAKRQFKSEIVNKFEGGHLKTIFFFLVEDYLKYFKKDERMDFCELIFKAISNSLKKIYQKDGLPRKDIIYLVLTYLIDTYNSTRAKDLLKDSVRKIFEKGHQKSIQTLIDDLYLSYYFKDSELLSLLFESNSLFTQRVNKYFNDNPIFKERFQEYLSECRQFDLEQKKKTGEDPRTANEYITAIITSVIASDYEMLKLEFTQSLED